jgi:hypothetical protein
MLGSATVPDVLVGLAIRGKARDILAYAMAV